MNSELNNRLHQLDALEWQLRSDAPATPQDPVGDLARHAVSHLAVSAAGELAGELLGRKRIGTTWMRRQITASKATQRAQAEAQERQRALTVLDQAEAVVNSASHYLAPKSLASLRKAAADARSAARPETVTRRTRTYLGRARVAVQGALEIPSPPVMLAELERRLRKAIMRVLSNEKDWWTARIPGDVREQAERRANGRQPLIDYVDFPDYQKIILPRRNWDPGFRAVFPNRDWIALRLTELAQLRNHIAHSRLLGYDDAMKFRVLSREIIERLER